MKEDQQGIILFNTMIMISLIHIAYYPQMQINALEFKSSSACFISSSILSEIEHSTTP